MPVYQPPTTTRFFPRYPVVTQGWGGYGDPVGFSPAVSTITTAVPSALSVYAPGSAPVPPSASTSYVPGHSASQGWDPMTDWTHQDAQLYPDVFAKRRAEREARMKAMIASQMHAQLPAERRVPIWGWALIAAVGYSLWRSFRRSS